MNTCLQGLGSARLQGKLQGIVYIDDIMIMISLQAFLEYKAITLTLSSHWKPKHSCFTTHVLVSSILT